MTEAVILTLSVYILLTLIFSGKLSAKSFIDAFIKAHLVIFLFITIITEILSLKQSINITTILSIWLTALLACIIIFFYLIRLKKLNLTWHGLPDFNRLQKIYIAVIGFMLGTTFFSAYFFPPNNWDSMTYHMSRVMHWVSNNSVNFYATSIDRQNYYMPLAEYAIMHLQILTGSDLYANFVQWVSFLVVILAGILIAAEFGMDRSKQLLTGVIVATVPMAILQASSTQNDLVVSGFVMIFALYMLRTAKNISFTNVTFTSLSLGLALLAKGIAYLYCAGMGVALALFMLYKYRLQKRQLITITLLLFLIVFAALLVNGGYFYRNYQLYGNPLPNESFLLPNSEINLKTFYANIFKNTALHLGTPVEFINRVTFKAVQIMVGPYLDKPEINWSGTIFFIPYSRHEDNAGNLFHMLLIIITLGLLPLMWQRGRELKTFPYLIGIVIGASIYCLLMFWQPWASRLHTPLFMLTAPIVVVTITSFKSRVMKAAANLFIAALILFALPFAYNNLNRSLMAMEWYNLERQFLYFTNRPYLYEDYYTVLHILKDKGVDEDIGLYFYGDDWEYPLWALSRTGNSSNQSLKFRHIGVDNISSVFENKTFLPQYVIATRPLDSWDHGANYSPLFYSEYLLLYGLDED